MLNEIHKDRDRFAAFVRHLQSAWEHLHAAEKLYPEGCDAFTVSGHVERAKHDCKQAARLVGGLPNDKCPDCGKPMDCDEGQRMTRQEPEVPPCVYCPDCGTEYPMTHNDRTELPARVTPAAHDNQKL